MFNGCRYLLIIFNLLSSIENYTIKSSIFKIYTISKPLCILNSNENNNIEINVPYVKALLDIVPTLKNRFFFPGNSIIHSKALHINDNTFYNVF